MGLGSGCASVAERTSVIDSSDERGERRIDVTGSDSSGNQPPGTSRRPTTKSQGSSADLVVSRLNRSADAPSMCWASSVTMRVGVGSSACRNSVATSSSRRLRNCSSSPSVSLVSGRSRSSTVPSSGSHGTSCRASNCTRSLSARHRHPGRCARGDAEQVPEQRAERKVGRRRVVLVAEHGEDRQVVRLLGHRRDQPRLPDPRLSEQLHQAAMALSDALEAVAENRHLVLTPDQQACLVGALAHADEGADPDGMHLGRFSLDPEGLDRHGIEDGAAVRIGGCGRQHLAGSRLGEHPRGEVDRVALHRVGPAERRAEVAREDVPGVDADAQRQPAARRPWRGGQLAASGPRRVRCCEALPRSA